MKLISKLVMIGTLLLSCISVSMNNAYQVQAKESYSDYYPMQCDAFEVDTVNDSGSFYKKGCYASFSEAKTVMERNGNDAVVRHASSYSPTKIIAMNSGIAYTYPMRSGGATTTIYQYGGTKSTYIPKHIEVKYFSTESYENGSGDVHINITDFDGIINLKNIDLVPYKFITNNLPIYLGGNDTTDENEQPFYVRCNQSYYVVEQNGNYKELRFVAYSGWAINGNQPNKKFNAIVGPAASWMNVGDVYYSYNDYDFYSDRYYTNQVGTYYNYYQYMPLRQKSDISASSYNSFLQANGIGSESKLWNQGQTFVDAQNKYGVNALLLFAEAVNESGWGKSSYALDRNNLFGVSAYDDDPNQARYFNSVEEAIDYQASVLLREYCDTDDYRFFGSHFGNKGSGISVKYASDPYYGYVISSLAYQFDKIYNGNDGNLTEFNENAIGVINTYGVGIKNSINGSVLYTSEYGATYQKNFTVSILEENGDWYKIQTTNYIVDGKKYSFSGEETKEYDWNTNVGWIEKKYVTLLSGNVPDGNTDTTIIGTATVNVSGLNIRKGPGTSYSTVGVAQEGGSYYVYDVVQDDSYTWYRIGTNQWFASKDNWVTYTKKEETKKDDSSNTNTDVVPSDQYETIDALEENRKMIAAIQDVQFNEESHVVTISGLALFRKMNAISGEVKHDLILTNADTKKAIVIPCTTENSSEQLLVGYTTNAVKFTTSFDLDDFDISNYYIGIRVTNNDNVGYYSFFMNGTDYDHSYTSSNGLYVKLCADPSSNYRYSLSVEKQSIDMSVINKPSALVPKFGTTSLSLENGHLTMEAYAGIYQTDFTPDTNPTYKILIEKEDGTLSTFDTNISSSQQDITRFMKCNNSYTRTWFHADCDLTNLSSGTYRVYIDVSTTQARDIFEMYSIQDSGDITGYANGHTYRLTKTNTRSRYLLTIE